MPAFPEISERTPSGKGARNLYIKPRAGAKMGQENARRLEFLC
jgi:hypothetical protein